MVNHGPSKGCWTCRKRRVKCDEGRPSCHQCSRLGRDCGGYGPDTRTRSIRFKSQGSFSQSSSSESRSRTRTDIVPATIVLSDESTAICFFLTSIVGLGRGFKSTQGFLEPLLPVVANEHPNSVLSTVVSAVSTKIWGFWKNPLRSYESPHSPFTRALVHLQAALNDPVERSKDSTVLSVILMHFYEGVAARSMHRPSIRAHQDGACALLKQQANSVPQSECCAFLRNYLRHCDVSAYLESQASDTSDLDIWFDEGWDENMPVNPNTVLDLIGFSLAHLQTRLSDMKRCVKQVAGPRVCRSATLRMDSVGADRMAALYKSDARRFLLLGLMRLVPNSADCYDLERMAHLSSDGFTNEVVSACVRSSRRAASV